MPKKTAGRGGASRNRPKAQKSVQLVRPNATVSEKEIPQDETSVQDESSVEEETTLAVPTKKAASASTATASKTETVTSKKTDRESAPSQAQKPVEETTPATGKGSAAARLAARRQGQAGQKTTVARPASLITAEHYSYVRRDLIYILILAIIMFSAIIILHFVPAIGG